LGTATGIVIFDVHHQACHRVLDSIRSFIAWIELRCCQLYSSAWLSYDRNVMPLVLIATSRFQRQKG